MRKTLITVAIVAFAALVATTGFAASRGATFTPIGLFPRCDEVPEGEFCENFPLTTVTGMSADGQTIVGMHAFFSGGYVWTADAGLNTVGPVYGGMYVSRAGDTIASTYHDPDVTFEWSAIWEGGFYPDQTWSYIPLADGFAPCGTSGQNVYDVSSSVAVGLTWVDRDGNGNGCDGASAFLWDRATNTTTVLPNTINDDSTRANATSEDGSVVVGWMQTTSREASVWVDGEQSFLCPNPTGAGGDIFCDEAWDVTPDGSTILTTMAGPGEFMTRATIIDLNGNYEQLPFPDGGYDPFWDTFRGWAISDDGGTVVGTFGGSGWWGSPPYPVLYNKNLDMTIDLQVMLLGQGLDDLFFWYLSSANAVNADGTIIAGYGFNPDGWLEAYRVDISKVKMCHKPDGQGQGNRRTLAIGWDSVADHLAHGDALATCEFAESSAASRFAQRRSEIGAAMNPKTDARMSSVDDLMRVREAVTGKSFDGSATPTFSTIESRTQEQQDTPAFTQEERTRSLKQRLQRPAIRR